MLKRANHLRLAALPAAIMMAGSTYAQQSAEEPVQIEEVVVVGIRASIEKSIDDKRNAKNIVDTINAEDIGKSTDQNIAEALNRVSGVSINTENGEGTTISIRGANADQTVVTLNGAALGTTGFSQGVDLSSYSADILSKVEIVKTPSADHEEGALGGLVNLKTRKPLDIAENVRTISAQGRYNDLSEEDDYKLSGTFSQKFLDDTFGLVVTLTDETNSVRRDDYEATRYRAVGSHIYTDASSGIAYTTQAAKDAETAASGLDGRANEFEDLTASQPLSDPNLRRHGAAEYQHIVRGLAPTDVQYALRNNKSERSGIDLSLQWEASDATDITFSFNHNKSKFDNRADIAFIGLSEGFPGHIDGVNQPNLGLNAASFRDRDLAYIDNPFSLGGSSTRIPALDDTGAITLDRDGNIRHVGVAGGNSGRRWTDPEQDWKVLDPTTRTWTTYRNRHDTGSVQASINKFESENTLAGIELNHSFENGLDMTFGLSSQESEQTPDTNIFLSAARTRVIGPWNLHHVPANVIQPAGYDCSTGVCRLTGGTSTPFLGDVVDLQLDLGDLWDNIGSTGFNPDDLDSHTLNFIESTVTEVSDEQKTAFVDFDLEFEAGPITSFEFGGKYTKREKLVDDQSGTPAPSGDTIQAISPLTGQTIQIDPSNISLIQASLFDAGEASAPGFLRGLGYSQDHITDGWRRFDPVAALEAVSQNERDFTLDRTETRSAEFDNIALYFKANFSMLDERLVGDVGLRYVRTEVDTSGFAGAVFSSNDVTGGNVINPIALKRLRDYSIEAGNSAIACEPLSGTPSPIGLGDASEFWTNQRGDGDINDGRNYDLTSFETRNRLARVDGLGFDPNGTLDDISDDVRLPATNNGLCHDEFLFRDGVNDIPETFLERNLTRYADVRTDQNYGIISRNFDSEGNLIREDRSRPSFATEDDHDYDVFLPSLNISYAVTDDFITRFAASKTMSRPPIDDLRSGFSAREGNIFDGSTNFRTGNQIDLFSAKIDPLESTNLDLSLEWYFDDDALLSLNLFAKDISNLIETRDTRYFIGDIAELAANPSGATFDPVARTFTTADGDVFPLLLQESGEAGNPDISQCMARRIAGESNLASAGAIIFGDDSRLLCDEYNITERVNANKATVQGLEFQYSQNYSFLPGAWSGLGTQFNYTYQDGKFKDSKFPIAGTPEQSYNATLFWAEGGHQVRLAYSGATDSLVQGSIDGGASWREGRETLDLSVDVAINDNLSIQFNAQNLTDEPVRTYFTSRTISLDGNGQDGTPVLFDEGSAIGGNAPDSRTLLEYNTGTIYRLGLRAKF